MACGCTDSSCACVIQGQNGVTVSGSGNAANPYLISPPAEQAFAAVEGDGIDITPGGTAGHAPTIAAVVDPASTADITLSAAGIRVDTSPATEVDPEVVDYEDLAYHAADSEAVLNRVNNLLAWTFDPIHIGPDAELDDGELWLVAMNFPRNESVTGVGFIVSVEGDYTADSNNRIGLYELNGTDLDLVAASNDDGNLWKATAEGFTQAGFALPYTPDPLKDYWIGLLYNNSAEVDAPLIYGSSSAGYSNINLSTLFRSGTLAAQTDLPASTPVAGITPVVRNLPFLGAY